MAKWFRRSCLNKCWDTRPMQFSPLMAYGGWFSRGCMEKAIPIHWPQPKLCYRRRPSLRQFISDNSLKVPKPVDGSQWHGAVLRAILLVLSNWVSWETRGTLIQPLWSLLYTYTMKAVHPQGFHLLEVPAGPAAGLGTVIQAPRTSAQFLPDGDSWTLSLCPAQSTAAQNTWMHQVSTCSVTSLVYKGLVVQKVSAAQTFVDVLNLRCGLDLEHSILFFSQDTPPYDDIPTKFGCKRVGNSEGTFDSHIIFLLHKPHCDLDHEVGTKIFVRNSPAHDDASSYQVWSQRLHWFRWDRPDKHSLTFWIFAVTFDLQHTIQFSHKTLRLMVMYHQTQFGLEKISSSEETVERVMFWLYKPSLWPWPWI